MKRNYFFIPILFFFVAIQAQQSAIVTYKAKLNTAPEIYNSIKEKFGVDMMQRKQRGDAKVNEILKDFEFTLQFNPQASRYHWQEDMPDETVNKGSYMMAKLVGSGHGIYYCNMPENLYMKQFRTVASHSLVRETAQLRGQKWQITKATDIILGYPVIKAIQGKKVAWFTPAIPVPFGPGEARGLPGLILKYIFAQKRVIYATKINWYKKHLDIKRPTKGLLRTQAEGRAKRIKEMDKYLGN